MDSGSDLLVVRTVVNHGCLRVVLAGELDLEEVPALYREVRRVMQSWPQLRQMKIDLRHLKFVDLCGLRALAAVCREAEQAAGRVSVIGVPRHVRRAVEVTGIQMPGVTGKRQHAGDDIIAVTDFGRAKRRRTAVPAELDRSSTRSHS